MEVFYAFRGNRAFNFGLCDWPEMTAFNYNTEADIVLVALWHVANEPVKHSVESIDKPWSIVLSLWY